MPTHIGTSGWSYGHWEPELYPPGLPAAQRLARFVEAFATAELNSSFYHWPKGSTFRGWRERLPEGFLLSVKAPRGLTHSRKLNAPELWVQRIADCWHELRGRRGIFLVQLSPSHVRDDERLERFLELLPEWVRVAVEFRHPSWNDDGVFALLERRRAAYCVMSGAGLPCILRATASFVYVRLHGPDDRMLYGGSYGDESLAWWAERLREWERMGKENFVYFNNDGDANAVRNARTLRAMLG